MTRPSRNLYTFRKFNVAGSAERFTAFGRPRFSACDPFQTFGFEDGNVRLRARVRRLVVAALSGTADVCFACGRRALAWHDALNPPPSVPDALVAGVLARVEAEVLRFQPSATHHEAAGIAEREWTPVFLVQPSHPSAGRPAYVLMNHQTRGQTSE